MTQDYKNLLVKAFKAVLAAYREDKEPLTSIELLATIKQLQDIQKEDSQKYMPMVAGMLLQVQGYMFAYGELGQLPKGTWTILVEEAIKLEDHSPLVQ